MSYDPRDTVNDPKINPNQGMHAKSYIAIIVVSVLVLLGAVIIFGLGAHGKSSFGKAPTSTAPASSQASPQ